MTDAEGKLTAAEKKQIQDWLAGVGWATRLGGCPVCGDNKWTIADHIVQPITRGAGNALNLGGPGYPHVMLISNKCGYTIFLNAVMIGLLQDQPEETQESG